VNQADDTRALQSAAHFLFEVGMLRRTPRSGLQFLGSGADSVAEHMLRTAYVGFVLGSLVPGVDRSRLVFLALLHDLPEARTGDLNYENKKYVHADEARALRDLAQSVPFGADLEQLIGEFNADTSLEARLANDADQLELLLVLKEEMDRGNPQAKDWIPFALKRLREPVAQRLAAVILATHSSDWWFGERSEWWVWAGREARAGGTAE
jgi:putative hydrolases of HD superfamily